MVSGNREATRHAAGVGVRTSVVDFVFDDGDCAGSFDRPASLAGSLGVCHADGFESGVDTGFFRAASNRRSAGCHWRVVVRRVGHDLILSKGGWYLSVAADALSDLGNLCELSQCGASLVESVSLRNGFERSIATRWL